MALAAQLRGTYVVAMKTATQSARLSAAFLVLLALLQSVLGCQSYDALIAQNEACTAKWADYEVQLQRRADLIPNLVNTVKGSAKHEADTLAKVTQARADATSIKLSADDFSDEKKVQAFQDAQNKLGAMGRLLVSNEAYPDLKGTQGFRDLQVQLEGTENRIARSREEYNGAVRLYNTELGKIRGQAINKITGKAFAPRVYFGASADSKNAPAVTF
jgi:LemA protein